MFNLKSILMSVVLVGVAVPSFAAVMDCCCCKDKTTKTCSEMKQCPEMKMKCCDDAMSHKHDMKHDMTHGKMPMSDMKDSIHSMPMDHSGMKMPMDHADMKMPTAAKP